MSNFENTDRVITEIKRLLNNDEKFRKLLKYNTPNALELSAPEKSETDSLIKVTPAIYMNEDPESILMTTFSVIYTPVITFENSINTITYMVDIFTKKEIAELDSGRLRLHQMLDRIYNTLSNKRVSVAGRLSVDSASYIVVGTTYIGYQVEMSVIDEPIENDF